MNDGKLPSTSDTQKHVGGSYYVVKKILQELQYNSNMSNSISGSKKYFVKEITAETECFTEVEEVSTSKISVDAGIQDDSQRIATSYGEIVKVSGKHLKTEKGTQTLSLAEKTFSKEIVDPVSIHINNVFCNLNYLILICF